MVEQDIQLQTLSGELRDVVIRVTVPADETEWARILVMAIDVTARNRAQAKLAQTQAELAHAARVSTLGMLTASIAHEVNQPLSAIITYAKSGRRWLGQGERGAREALDCLDHIVANGSRAAGVIARVRSQAKGASPQTESLDLVTLVNEAIEVISREAQDNAITVRATFPEQVPSIMGDKIQIQQVVINLMVNAIHSMTQLEEHALELCVEVTLGDSQVVLSVSDCGGGIGVEPSRLFDPFFTTKKDGMGMGLSICRSIVESHGGRIWAANRDEGGAVFSFTLPAMKSPAVSAA